ncbi:uncharacterized protein B0H18DRAFT_967242 [Fomitopsis serialis]|uniref:uncharacterized protein n=1 Tax=Fomitopsis serialis TaxID=139415 RepID=UPI002007DA62|nr:uncharacterized protein B0H18DRAFT_967242 [Neoantrodia serialis]KAH9938449.1 hypothetical protein B0H18DRAFT_967242 [Neoantrodia serialis]
MLPPAARALVRTAAEFLNGILASSVPAHPQSHFYSAFLHAQGRVLYDTFVYSQPTASGKQGYLIEYDARPSEAPPLLPTLKKYVLRSKVKIRNVSEEYDGEKAWETQRRWLHASSGAIEPVYLLHRITHGVPEGSTDIVPMQAFPMESNLDVMGALDFRKGCFVGQELTVRTYHTGIIRKRILPVLIEPSSGSASPSEEAPSFPSDLDIRAQRAEVDDGTPKPRPRGTGKLLSSTKGVGLALLRLEHVAAAENGTAVFEMEVGEEHKTKWKVTPWWPDWWPRMPENQQV